MRLVIIQTKMSLGKTSTYTQPRVQFVKLSSELHNSWFQVRQDARPVIGVLSILVYLCLNMSTVQVTLKIFQAQANVVQGNKFVSMIKQSLWGDQLVAIQELFSS